MTRTLTFTSSALYLALAYACGCSEDAPPPEATQPLGAEPGAEAEPPAPAEPATGTAAAAQDDIEGRWDGTLSHRTVAGPCPATPTQNGALTLEQEDAGWTMRLGAGFTCSPASACVFTGTRGEGGALEFSNEGAADDEGGRYSTTLELHSDGGGALTADGTSTYRMGEMECRWTTTLTAGRGGA